MLRRMLLRTGWAASIILLVTMGYISGWSARNEVAAQERQQLLTATEKIYANIYNQVSPSVVSISVVERLFGTEVSNGSGFVIDREGHIITNAHVIDDVDSSLMVVVTFFDGMHVRAEIVGTDLESDLAVLHVNVESRQLRPVIFANSDSLIIGQMAVAIGSPFGQRWTMTSGIISALDRTIEGLGNFEIGAVIQTDAPINPGNSGGPLLNMAGEVIGVNAQIISENRRNSGVGFAIPSNLAMRVADDLRVAGRVRYAYLGVQSTTDISLRDIERLGIPNNTRGLIVGGVIGPAQAAGLQTNDIIIAIDNRPISGLGTLLAYLATNTLPGQTVRVTILRSGQEVVIPVELGIR